MNNLVHSTVDDNSDIYMKEEVIDASDDPDMKLEITINDETFQLSDATISCVQDIMDAASKRDNQNCLEDVGTLATNDPRQMAAISGSMTSHFNLTNSGTLKLVSNRNVNPEAGFKMKEKKILVSYDGQSIVLDLSKIPSTNELYEKTKKMLSIDEDFQLLRFDKDFEVDVLVTDVSELSDKERITVKKKISVPSQKLPKPSHETNSNSSSCPSSWSFNFEVPDFGISSAKLKEGLELERSDEEHIAECLFGAVRKHTSNPEAFEFSNITFTLLKKYPQLRGNLDWNEAYKLWRMKIFDHFQNNRQRQVDDLTIGKSKRFSDKRKRVQSNTCPDSPQSRKKVYPENHLSNRPPDSTDESGEETINFVNTEKSKRKPSPKKVAKSEPSQKLISESPHGTSNITTSSDSEEVFSFAKPKKKSSVVQPKKIHKKRTKPTKPYPNDLAKLQKIAEYRAAEAAAAEGPSKVYGEFPEPSRFDYVNDDIHSKYDVLNKKNQELYLRIRKNLKNCKQLEIEFQELLEYKEENDPDKLYYLAKDKPQNCAEHKYFCSFPGCLSIVTIPTRHYETAHETRGEPAQYKQIYVDYTRERNCVALFMRSADQIQTGKFTFYKENAKRPVKMCECVECHKKIRSVNIGNHFRCYHQTLPEEENIRSKEATMKNVISYQENTGASAH